MDEQAWLVSTDTNPMLEFLHGKASNRKLRLFACACCRSIWDLLTDEHSRTAVEGAERFADDDASEDELQAARAAAWEAVLRVGRTFTAAATTWMAVSAMPELGRAAAAAVVAIGASMRERADGAIMEQGEASVWLPEVIAASLAAEAGVKAKAADVLRDLISNPFCPISFDPGWLTPPLVSLAQAAYDERILPSGKLDSARLVVLSDALEEAGCTDAAILDHLRSPGLHVRGCQVLDLLLGKS